MATLDVFNADAFSLVEMTSAIDKVPYKPQRIAQLDIFDPKPIRTTKASIEERDGQINVIQTSRRGEPLEQRETEKRTARWFDTTRIAKGDRLTASELQDIRAFGTESELKQVMQEVAHRMNGKTGLRAEMELTHENMRMGALQGVVVDADGSTIIDWYDEFGVTKPATVNFDLSAASPASGAIRKKCNGVVRAMQTSAKGAWISGLTHVHAFCGDDFWDDLTAAKEVRETYLNTMAAAELRDGNVYESFRYGGITFENYRGTDDGTTVAVDSDDAIFFPVEAPGAFQVAWSPAEFLDQMNSPGQEIYAMVVPDEKRNAFVDIEVYSYPLHICTRPGMLQSAKRKA